MKNGGMPENIFNMYDLNRKTGMPMKQEMNRTRNPAMKRSADKR
jgi:hypothetical protein